MEEEKYLKCKAMIFTLGGSLQPIIKSILHYKPEFVSFLASNETHTNVGKIKEKVYEEQATEEQKYDFECKTTITEDPEDLLICYKNACKAIEIVLDKNYKKDDIIIDYTGGTKNMSVAVSLAGINYGFRFSYIGGERIGPTVVINGKEKVIECVNPWDYLAINEFRSLSILFNKYQFKAAKEITDAIIKKITKNKSLFRKINSIINAYYYWDIFKYDKALEKLKKAYIDEFKDYDGEKIDNFIESMRKNINILEKIACNKEKPSKILIIDIFSNALRRYEEGKVDDAIVRLYMVMELIAQERLSSTYNIDTSNVDINLIPENLRSEFSYKYKNERNKKIEIGQAASYRLLMELNDDIGLFYKSNEKEFKIIQEARNYSFLIHGFKPSSEDIYNKTKSFILNLNIFNENDIIKFPKIPEFKIKI